MKITAIRGLGLKRAPDVLEELVDRVDLMVIRGTQEIEDSQDVRRVTVRAAYRDGLRNGQMVRSYDENGLPVQGKLVGLQHEVSGKAMISVLTIDVPAQRIET